MSSSRNHGNVLGENALMNGRFARFRTFSHHPGKRRKWTYVVRASTGSYFPTRFTNAETISATL